METSLLSKKIENIERDLHKVRIMLKPGKKVISLKGLLKGMHTSEDEIELAKKALFNVR